MDHNKMREGVDWIHAAGSYNFDNGPPGSIKREFD